MKKNAENTNEVLTTTKTVNPLTDLIIRRGDEILESLPITCPGQMWRELKGCALFNKFGADVTIQAIRDTGEVYMEFVQCTRKDGTPYMKQNIVENHRAQVMKRNAAAKKEEEEREAKNAKRREARAARKAKNTQIVPAPTSVKETPAEDEPALAEA